MSLESFKSFVRKKPELIDYVKRREMSWQDFYNLYELYGETSSIWDKYGGTSSVSMKNILSFLRNIDKDEIQNGINSLQKGIGYLQDMVSNNSTSSVRGNSYTPRPIHKHFDD